MRRMTFRILGNALQPSRSCDSDAFISINETFNNYPNFEKISGDGKSSIWITLLPDPGEEVGNSYTSFSNVHRLNHEIAGDHDEEE